jgi:hypothetical protein
MVGVSQAQAFLDGNKRAAFAIADVFLRINGLVYQGDPMARSRRRDAQGRARSQDEPDGTVVTKADRSPSPRPRRRSMNVADGEVEQVIGVNLEGQSYLSLPLSISTASVSEDKMRL